MFSSLYPHIPPLLLGGRSSSTAEWLHEAKVISDTRYPGDRGRSPSRVAVNGRAVVPDRRVVAGGEGHARCAIFRRPRTVALPRAKSRGC
jgi:hypothetical protein